jgi:hypothetical protein
MNRESLKGHVDLPLMVIVGVGASYGYLARRLEEASAGALTLLREASTPLSTGSNRGNFFRARGAVAGRRRRVYDLARAGEESIARGRLESGSFAKAVDSVLDTL